MAEHVFSCAYHLSAGECGPEQVLPVALIIDRCIAVATDHANALGIGYDDLKAHGQAWVLSRIALEMETYPSVNEKYTVETWVESFNRAFSVRNFRILDAAGRECGQATSVWVAIDVERRTLADISRFDRLKDSITSGCKSSVRPCGKHRPVGADAEVTVREFRYSDIDANRHVNSVRYVEMLLDCWSLEFFYTHRVKRLEVSFVKESFFGQKALITVEKRGLHADADIMVESESHVHFSVDFNEI